MTMTEHEAFEMMLQHHRTLVAEVDARVAAVQTAGGGVEPLVGELVAYLAEEVLPHAEAEERTIYPAASALPGLARVVDEMVADHRVLATAIETLAATDGADDARRQSAQIASFFKRHVDKENEVLLPALIAEPTADLAQLLAGMHDVLGAASEPTPAEVAATRDPLAQLQSLLITGATELATAGRGDHACRLVASSWAAVRTTRPDLAVRATAALHRLARLARSEPIALRTSGSPSDAHDRELDVRALAPAQRHERIFAEFLALEPESGYVLVNDHDPKPLRYQFEAEHEGEFTWDALESGPSVWRVRIAKTAAATRGAAGAAGDAAPGEIDVRTLPHGQRHDVIFSTYDGLVPGRGFVIVNDHDPQPLRYQFEATHANEFTWSYLEAGPRVWRVLVTKERARSRV